VSLPDDENGHKGRLAEVTWR